MAFSPNSDAGHPVATLIPMSDPPPPRIEATAYRGEEAAWMSEPFISV